MAARHSWLVACAACAVALFGAGRASADDSAEAIAMKLIGAFQAECETPVEGAPPPSATRCDELAYDAAHAFRTAREPAKSIAAYRKLIARDARGQARSPLGMKALREIGEAYQGLAVFDLAADWYERFATEYPNEPGADSALREAALLRLGMGDEDQATKDARVFAKAYARALPTQTAELALVLASHHAEREDWEKARATLVTSMAAADTATFDVRLRAHALLAKVYARSGEAARPLAAAEYAVVRAMPTGPKTEQAVRDAWPNESEAQVLRRVAKAINAYGEALFAAAEERQRAEVEPLAAPASRAATPVELAADLRVWVDKKRAAIASVETEYLKILDIQPVPPPIWIIAAASRTGLMWAGLELALARVRTPAAWTPQIRASFLASLDGLREPIKVRNAKPALKKCLDLSMKYQFADESSRACEAWLTQNYKGEFHRNEDAIPSLRVGAPSPAPPVARDGTPRRE